MTWSKWIRWICMAWMIAMSAMVYASPAAAQGSAAAERFGMILNDAQIESWLGREARIRHPVMEGLVSKDAATLHFYFSRAYGQRAEGVIATSEKAREKTLRFLPEETVAGVTVYLLPDINDYFIALGSQGRAPEWSAGLTILRDGVILIRLAPRGTTRVEAEMTLAHELNHAALRRYVGENAVPHWFYEGLAMTATDDWNLQRAEVLSTAAMGGRLLDLSGIDEAFGKTGTLVDLAYAQSAHFVSWLAKDFGDDAVRQLIRETSNGVSFDTAFYHAFGRSPKAAFALWRDHMSRGESFLASLFSHDGLFFFISIFAAFALSVALWRRSRLRRERLAAMSNDLPDSSLPPNLRNFGPFAKYSSKE